MAWKYEYSLTSFYFILILLRMIIILIIVDFDNKIDYHYDAL
jgi:hypothetical protein